jgi:hypothetical protein
VPVRDAVADHPGEPLTVTEPVTVPTETGSQETATVHELLGASDAPHMVSVLMKKFLPGTPPGVVVIVSAVDAVAPMFLTVNV